MQRRLDVEVLPVVMAGVVRQGAAWNNHVRSAESVWQQRLTSRMTSDFLLGKWHVYLKCFLFSASSLSFIVVFPSWGLRWGGFHFGDGAFGTLVLSEARKQTTKHVISELFMLIKRWRCFLPYEPLFASFTATYGLKKFLKIYFLFWSIFFYWLQKSKCECN